MERLRGGTSGSAGKSDVEVKVSNLNLHIRRKERWNLTIAVV